MKTFIFILLIAYIVLLFIFIAFLTAVKKGRTPEESKWEDDDQAAYLAKLRENHVGH